MANQNNNQNRSQSQNQSGGSTNQKKRRFFRKSNNKPKSNGVENGSGQKVPAKREYKFHMHDAQARRSSESYEKIKNAIILKIQESFEDSKYVVESLKKKTKKVIAAPDHKNYRSTLTDPEEKAAENEAKGLLITLTTRYSEMRKDGLKTTGIKPMLSSGRVTVRKRFRLQ